METDRFVACGRKPPQAADRSRGTDRLCAGDGGNLPHGGQTDARLLSDPERFRDWVDERGLWGRAAFVGMMSVQIIAAMIPGEPLEIAAGYAFGAAEGTALCLLGALLGGTAVFLGVRRFGRRAVEAFFPPEKIDALPLLRNGRRLEGWLFVVFLFPGTPRTCLPTVRG